MSWGGRYNIQTTHLKPHGLESDDPKFQVCVLKMMKHFIILGLLILGLHIDKIGQNHVHVDSISEQFWVFISSEKHSFSY